MRTELKMVVVIVDEVSFDEMSRSGFMYDRFLCYLNGFLKARNVELTEFLYAFLVDFDEFRTLSSVLARFVGFHEFL